MLGEENKNMTTPHKEGPEYRPEELRLLDKRVAELKGFLVKKNVDAGKYTEKYKDNAFGSVWHRGKFSELYYDYYRIVPQESEQNYDSDFIEKNVFNQFIITNLPYYSTNLDLAWKLFEEMPNATLSKGIKKHIDSSSDHISYTCAFYVEGDSKTVGYAKMATSPNSASEAICLCYIKFKDQTLDLPKGE